MFAAEVRAPSADHDALDRAAATAPLATFAGLSISAMMLLESAAFAADIPIIRHRIAAQIYSARQSLFDRREKQFHFGQRNIFHALERVNAGAPQRFVRVDIADAGDYRLIHEDLLDFAMLAKVQSLGESFESEAFLQRFRSDVFQVF